MKHLQKWSSYSRINESKTKKLYICGFTVNGVELKDIVSFEISDIFEEELYDYLVADGISDPIRLDLPVFVEAETWGRGDRIHHTFKRVNTIKELVERKIEQDKIESEDKNYLKELESIREVREVRIYHFVVRKTIKS